MAAVLESFIVALVCCFICCCAHAPDSSDGIHHAYSKTPKFSESDKVILVLSSPRFDAKNGRRSAEIKRTLRTTANTTYDSVVSLGSQTHTGKEVDWAELNAVFDEACPNKTVYVSLGYSDFLDNLGKCQDLDGDVTLNGCAIGSLRNIGSRLDVYKNVSSGFSDHWLQMDIEIPDRDVKGKAGSGSMTYSFDVQNSNYSIHVLHTPWVRRDINGVVDWYVIDPIYNSLFNRMRDDRRHIVFIHDANYKRYTTNSEGVFTRYNEIFKAKKVDLVISSSDIDPDSSCRTVNNVVVRDGVRYVRIGADVTTDYSWLILPRDPNSAAVLV